MMYFIFALLFLICILTVVCYALLVIASEEEKRAERMYRAWKERLKDDMENNGEPIDSDYNIGINHAMCVIEAMKGADDERL